jgi:SAM-dependent MidA family methyltransferase
VSPLEEKLAQLISREGPLPFSRFMHIALYDEHYGYYCGQPFGRAGDFFTAAQLQPVFGLLVRDLANSLFPGYETFVDLGAGREDLRAALSEKPYFPVHHGDPIPKTKNAFLFANEFFDALPVEVRSAGLELAVTFQGGRFSWYPREPISPVRERCPSLPFELERIYRACASPAVLLAIDYGYTAAELPKFPFGTLMSYRRHIAIENVLDNPGRQDITAHVDWDHFFSAASSAGWTKISFQRFNETILALGPSSLERLRLAHPTQLKQLLFELGPRFDVAVLAK